MLGQKGVCGLIVVLCCSLAHSSPIKNCCSCWTYLQEEAENLKNAIKDFFDPPISVNYVSAISAQLPLCNSSQKEPRHIVKAFHSLFQKLNATIDGAAEIKSLQINLKQQEVCLRHWNVSSSPIKVTYKEETDIGRKTLLVKASERYDCFMQNYEDF